MSGITKPSPSAYIKQQKGYWVRTIYTFFCKCPYQSVQLHDSICCHIVKQNFSEQTKHLCPYVSTEESSMTKYQDLNGSSQFCKISFTKIKAFYTLHEEVTVSAGLSNVPK